MVSPAPGSVGLVQFPFSDLSHSKLRPAVVLAAAGKQDFVLCQITSNEYSDPRAVALGEADFETGSLRTNSFARPGKLFTASARLMVAEVGALRRASLERVIAAVILLLQGAAIR